MAAAGSVHVNQINNVGATLAQIDAVLRNILVGQGRGTLLIAEESAEGIGAAERSLSDQLDKLKEAAKKANPDQNLHLFTSFLESLPEGASTTLRFRTKANIGLQHLARGDSREAVRWLLDACDEAPDDPRSVANRTLAIWIGGDAEGAYPYGLERLLADPTNKDLAAYLPQVAVIVPQVSDGLEGIPELLRQTEQVVVAQAVFLRGRDMRPDWWEWARLGAKRFPDSEHLKLFAAFSHVDEITRDEKAQRTAILTVEQRRTLVMAAEVLDKHWQAQPWLLHSDVDDARHNLAAAMVAYQLLHDCERALALAARIANEQLRAVDILHNAIMVAVSYGDYGLAEQLISLAPDAPELKYHAAIIAVQKDDWADAAVLFAEANVPPSEHRLAETVIALAPIKVAGRPHDGRDADPAPLRDLLQATLDSPRGLILIAKVATDLGLREVADEAFEAAVDAVPEDSHISTRLMVATYAHMADSASTVIRLLDGYLPFEGYESEQELLAVAHASEQPHRQRNLAYFDRMPVAVRRRREIARAHATVLLEVDKVHEGLALLRRLHTDDPTDAYIALRLLEALRRLGNVGEANRILQRLDLAASNGPPQYVMALAQLVVTEGYAERAYPVAYRLVRAWTEDHEIAMGYLTLGLFDQAPHPLFRMDTAGIGACVTIRGSGDASQTFVIDEGGDFFGIRVHSPKSGMATRVTGKHAGDTFQLNKLGADPEIWTITEIKSKYLHLHHRIMEEYETRFPDRLGIAKFTVGEDNIDTVLDVVRRSSEQKAKYAAIYTEREIPLEVAARGLGGDAASFAQFVRKLGGRISTCAGASEEREAAVLLARRFRGHGAVLDFYTAWVAADIGALPALKTWFDKLLVPMSATQTIDQMIAREKKGSGREQMTISWHNGQFYRNELTEEFRLQQIEALARIRDEIARHCEVRPVLVPNEISEVAEVILQKVGTNLLDAAFLAKEEGLPLLSDDLRYRQWARAAAGSEGFWLQAALLAAAQARKLSPTDYARAVVGLAAHGHDRVLLSWPLLAIIARQDEPKLPGLRTVLQFLADKKAEISSHLAIFGEFVNCLWSRDMGLSPLQVRAATGLALEALVEKRGEDWLAVLGAGIGLLKPRNHALHAYVATWLVGHFIDFAKLSPASRQPEDNRKHVKIRNASRKRRHSENSTRG